MWDDWVWGYTWMGFVEQDGHLIGGDTTLGYSNSWGYNVPYGWNNHGWNYGWGNGYDNQGWPYMEEY